MKLYLVRHGKAEAGLDDDRRRLTEEGRQTVEKVAGRLAQTSIAVDRIEHSGLVRAEETATILAGALQADSFVQAGLRPDDSVAEAARRFQSQPVRSLMMVGHLPFMDRLASYLLIGDPQAALLHFRTGSVAHLLEEEGHWTVEWLLSPRLA